MGARGPAPKPSELRAIEGGAGKGGRDLSHRPRKNSPKYAPLTEHPPDFLGREGKAEWRRLMAELKRIPGLTQRPDRAMLSAWCEEWERYRWACEDVKKNGHVLLIEDGETRDGRTLYIRPVKNPAVQISRDSLEKLISLSTRFGLTPGDRARLNIEKEKGEEDPILALLTGRGQSGG
jgi:P27 family predicted phage terminase small subunit